jgi:hypothetical protein
MPRCLWRAPWRALGRVNEAVRTHGPITSLEWASRLASHPGKKHPVERRCEEQTSADKPEQPLLSPQEDGEWIPGSTGAPEPARRDPPLMPVEPLGSFGLTRSARELYGRTDFLIINGFFLPDHVSPMLDCSRDPLNQTSSCA